MKIHEFIYNTLKWAESKSVPLFLLMYLLLMFGTWLIPSFLLWLLLLYVFNVTWPFMLAACVILFGIICIILLYSTLGRKI